MLCEIHQAEMKLVPAGVSKRTGKAYSAFYACQVQDCKWRPPQLAPQSSGGGGWSGVRQQVAHKVAPEKAVMTKEDWEAKEARTNKNILLQVAFKAAVELYTNGKIESISGKGGLYENAEAFHTWLLSQTEGQKPASLALVASQSAFKDEFEEANKAIDEALSNPVEGPEIHY